MYLAKHIHNYAVQKFKGLCVYGFIKRHTHYVGELLQYDEPCVTEAARGMDI